MKTFREFLNEADETANKIVQFKRKLAGATDPAEQERLRKAIADAQKARQSQAPKPSPLEGQKYKAPEVPPKAGPGTRVGGPNATIPGQPTSTAGQVKPTATSAVDRFKNSLNNQKPSAKPPSRIRNIGAGALKIGALTAADIAADTAISNIKDTKTRETTQAAKDLAMFASTPVLSGTLGISGSSAPSGSRDVGAYRIQKRTDPSGGEAGFDRFLATGKDKKGYTYNDPNAEKIMAYRRDRVGSKKPEDKPFRVGAAKSGGQIVPVEWGSVAGPKKVGTPAQAQSTKNVQQARQIASKSNVYGSNQGSALTGIGGPAKVDQKAGTLTTKGKTVKLASTQLIRDPKTGKQVVGDLAYKDGKATYLARPSIASRDTNLLSRFSRATGIGGQRERDVAAARTEYRTALKNTQAYTKGLGITTKSATAQNLPGYGGAPKPAVKPAAKPAVKPTPKPVAKPQVAGGGMGGKRGSGSSPSVKK